MKKRLLFGLIMMSALAFVSCNKGLKLTEKPVLLPAGTDGSYGAVGTYVLFGDWPQSLKADDVTVSSDVENVNGWECYKGSDGCYYVKEEADPYDDEGDIHEFCNGITIKEGEEYYFKVEPIKWRVVTDNYQGGKLLVAENVLTSSPYDIHYDSDNRESIERTINGETVYSNNYKYSTVRSYLNGLDGSDYDVKDFTGNGFINKAFTEKSIESINTVTVDNDAKSITDGDYYTCANTEDKIFLLSETEVRNRYGFDESDSTRIRKTTDYSRAMGAYSETYEEKYKNDAIWWLRSPVSFGPDSVQWSFVNGDIDHDSFDVSLTCGGVVPALSISF